MPLNTSPQPSPAPTKPPLNWQLRRSEQATLAVLIGSGLVSVVGWWLCQGGARGRLIEIERADPQAARFQVDINRADWPELATLPGVGRKTAERIVQSRQENGPFTEIDDLRRVRGIGPRTLEGLRPYLRPMARREAVAGK